MTQTSPKQNPQNTEETKNGVVNSTSSIEETQIHREDEITDQSSRVSVVAEEDKITYNSSEGSKAPQWWRNLTLRSKTMVAGAVIGVGPVILLGFIAYGTINQVMLNEVKQVETSDVDELKDIILSHRQRLLLIVFFSTLVTAAAAAVIATLLSEKLTHPLRRVSATVKEISQGNFDTSVNIQGNDEFGVLARDINTMTQRIQRLVEDQINSAQQAAFLSEIANSVVVDRISLDLTLDRVLEELRDILRVERVVIYQFNFDGTDYISHESCDPAYPSAMEWQIGDRCIPEEIIEQYRQGRFVPTDNVYEAGFHPDHLKLMQRLNIQANLVVPLLKQENTFGLLIAHHCTEPHQWQDEEINFLRKVATQLSLILDRLFLQEQQQTDNQRTQILKDITLQMSAAANGFEVLEVAVQQMRLALKCDRVIVYRFDANWKGTIINESVSQEFPTALNAEILDPCFADNYVEKYKRGRIQATPDIYDAGLTNCHLKQLEPFKVRANLVAPIICDGKLMGLFIAHQCSGPRLWETKETTFFSQVAAQIGFALERANLLEQQKQAEQEQREARQQLQQRALALLMEVDPVNQGDLTIRANVTEDEIGTIADSYNATIENLRKVVSQVQEAAGQVASTTNTNESSIRVLSQEAFTQAQDIAVALDQLQAMNTSIRAVAANAELAEATVQKATHTVEAGEDAMNRTVDGIMAIRQTVAETGKKVKRLGESSQKISKVVNLISSFADQTNLLALNASIEAAHAGEEGRGFAVVADEVRSLARQSAEATAEIEALVANIQSETNEVVFAMEAGTEQVVTGTKLVDETRKSLTQITAASLQITELVEAITKAAIEQSQTSQTVTQTMTQIAAISDKTSTETAQVSDSFKQLLEVAQSLQESVRQFRVN
ncbi:MAG: methyl-accepting chemotaxis protein [Cyanobacteria bacterium P01_G01_bin.49]